MRLEDIIQEKWSDKYKKSINCSNPKGFSQKAHCAGKKKNENIVTPITKKDAALSKQAKHLKMKSMFAPGPVSQTVGANDAFLNNMSQTAKDANTLSKAAGIDTNFTKNTVANALRNTKSNTRLTSKFGRNVNEAPKDWGDMNLDNDKVQQSIDYFYTDHGPNKIGGRKDEGNFKGFKVVTFNKSPDTLMFLVNNEDRAVFYVAYSTFEDGVAIGNVRSNGTVKATEVYAMLVDKFGTLYSDAHQTPQGRKIWSSLAKFFPNLEIKDTGDRLMATKKKNEATNQYVLTPHQNLPNTKSTVGGTTMVTKAFKNLQKQQANTQAAVDARQGAGQSEIGFAKKVNKSDFSKNIFPNINKKPRIVTNSMNESLDNVIKKAEIYVDMDGVLADFFGVWTKMIGVKNWKEVKDVDGALDKIRNTKDFWINLPLAPNASKLLNSIKKVKGNYNILSSPLPNDPNSEPQKREWVKKMLSGFAPKRVIITHNKSAYAKQPDGTPNILIDDYGDNISKWESAGGVGIQHSDKSVDNTVKRLEEDAFTDLGRLINRSIRPGFYKKAAEKFHEWLRDQTRPYRHSLGYYAMEWSNKYKNMDWRNLRRAYLEMFGDEALVESKEPKLVKDKKLKNLKTMNKPTRYERRKNYVQADENIKKKDTKNEN